MEFNKSKELSIIAVPWHELDVLAVISKALAEHGCILSKIELEGTKRLAYTIDGYRAGGYMYIEYFIDQSCTKDCTNHLDLVLRKCEQVLRWLDVTVINDDKHEHNVNRYYELFWDHEKLKRCESVSGQ